MKNKLFEWLNNSDLKNSILSYYKGKSFDIVSFVREKIPEIELIESTQMPNDVSGFIRKNNDKIYICVNSLDNPRRKRFTIAHELGHYFRHREEIDGEGFVDGFGKTMFRNKEKNKQENEANEFAAELLMPEDEFIEEWNKSDSNITSMANLFIVSESAIITRARFLNLIQDESSVNYFF